MNTYILTFPVSISNCHNINDKNIGMALNSSSPNTTSTTAAAVNEKHTDTTE